MRITPFDFTFENWRPSLIVAFCLATTAANAQGGYDGLEASSQKYIPQGTVQQQLSPAPAPVQQSTGVPYNVYVPHQSSPVTVQNPATNPSLRNINTMTSSSTPSSGPIPSGPTTYYSGPTSYPGQTVTGFGVPPQVRVTAPVQPPRVTAPVTGQTYYLPPINWRPPAVPSYRYVPRVNYYAR
jgi:hypothetical protein